MTTQRRASVPFADRMGHVTEFLLIGYLPLEEGRRVSPFLPLPPGTWRWIWKGGVENREDEDILQRWYSHRLSPGLWKPSELLSSNFYRLEKRMANPLQYSCLENSMDRGGWWATVHGAAESLTQLSD